MNVAGESLIFILLVLSFTLGDNHGKMFYLDI